MTIKELFEETKRVLDGGKPRDPKAFQQAMDAVMSMNCKLEIPKTEINEAKDWANRELQEEPIPSDLSLQILETIQDHSYTDVHVSSRGNGDFDVYFTEARKHTSNRLDIQFGKKTLFVYCHFDNDEFISDIQACVSHIESAFDEIKDRYKI